MAYEIPAGDRAVLEAYANEWKRLKAAGADQTQLDALHNEAEKIRAQYNYSGGADGTQQLSLANPGTSSTPTPVSGPGTSNIPPAASATSQQEYIEEWHKAQEALRLADLNAAYEKNVNALNAAMAKLPEAYNTARNQTAAVSEQNRAAFNEQAAAVGLNSGTGGQADLAMRNTLTGNLSSLDKQQAANLSDLEAQRTQLASDYNNAIASAIAENNIAKAQALYQEKVRVDESLIAASQYQNQQAQNSAQLLAASAGDFSGFKAAFGWTDAQIAAAEEIWRKQNPLLGQDYQPNPKPKPKPEDEDEDDQVDQAILDSLYAKLSVIEDRGVAVRSNALNIIQNYVVSKLISEDMAKEIMKNYGF